MQQAKEHAWSLLESIYDAPGDPERWCGALAALGRRLSGRPSVIVAAHLADGDHGRIYASGMDTSGLHEERRWLGHGPVASDPHLRPVGVVLPVSLEAPDLVESPLFRYVLGPRGVQPGPGMYVTLVERGSYQAASLLVLPPAPGAYEPSEADFALLKEVAPHFARALHLQLRLEEHTVTAEALLSALDRLVLGVLILDEDGRVSYANRSVAEALKIEPGLGAVHRDAPIDARTEAFRRVVTQESGDSDSGLVYPHPEDGRPLQVLFAPLRWDEHDVEARRRFSTAIFVSDPQTDSGDPVELFRELFGLTPAESRLAIMLLADHPLEQAAKNLGITVGTARTTLKRVFAKTGTNRQASLVRLLLTGVGQIRSS